MMKRTLSLWISVALFSLLAAAPAWAVKPRPPLGLSLQQAEEAAGETRITVTATAYIDIARVELATELSPGLSILKGEPDWEGPLKKGETRKIELVIRNPGHTGSQVIEKATIRLDGGATFVERSTLPLDGPQNKAPTRAPSIKRKQGEENIREFKGE
jgi:hypothetical protein